MDEFNCKYNIEKKNSLYPSFKEVHYRDNYWIDIDFGVKYIDAVRSQSPTIGTLFPSGYVGDNGITLSSTVTGILFPASKVGVSPYNPEVQFGFEIPHSYKLSATFTPHIHFINTTTVSSTVAVQFGIDFVNIVNSDINAYTSTVGVLITPDTPLRHKFNIGFGGEYSEGNPSIEVSSDILSGQIQGNFRRTNIATITISDIGYSNYAGDLGFLTLGFHIPLDQPGSRQEIIK